MSKNLYFKKTIFFLTTGTIIFYLISFNSVGQVSEATMSRKAQMDCQETVRVMNYLPLYTLRKDMQVTHQNILKLTTPEQRAVSRYLKDNRMSFIKEGQPQPVELTTYLYEARNRRTLGYKIVVHPPEDHTKVATYFSGTEGNILFSHSSWPVASQKWDCEATRYLK